MRPEHNLLPVLCQPSFVKGSVPPSFQTQQLSSGLLKDGDICPRLVAKDCIISPPVIRFSSSHAQKLSNLWSARIVPHHLVRILKRAA